MIKSQGKSLGTLAALAVIGLAACGDSATGAKGKGNVTLSFAGVRPASLTSAGLSANLVSAPMSIVVGGDNLIITEAKLVLRTIELKRSEGACVTESQSQSAHESDDCEEFEVGPMLVTLPVTTGTTIGVSVTAPAGTYTGVDFEIHKPGDDALDVAFKTANPDFANISIRVRGTFNGTAFEYTSRVSASQKIHLDTPLVVTDGESANLTLSLDLDTWFRVGRTTGTLVDPNTANAGGANEQLVRDNIKASIRAFKDDNRNGDDRDH